MPLETNLNINPYFDDFDAEKDYYKILFKPGVAVQTRELNQLQTLLQTQIERFGDHVFKTGTIVSGVNFNYLSNYQYAKIVDQQRDGQTALPSAYEGLFVKNSANLTARVVNSIEGLESKAPDMKAVYLQYVNSGNDGSTVFSPDQELTVFSIDNPIFKVSVENGGAGFANSDSVVFTSAMVINVTSGAGFSNGEEIYTSGANAEIVGIDTTTVSGSTILKIKPLDIDLYGTDATKWEFAANDTITGVTSGATAKVESLIGSGANAVITTDAGGIVQLVTLQATGEDYIVVPHVTLQTANSGARLSDLNLVPQTYKAKIVVGNSSVNAVGTGYAFGVSGGLIYQKGYFLRVDPQVLIVDPFSSSPNNVAVGFKTEEAFVDAFADETLYDNASNTTNFAAPGADRLNLTPVLTKLTIDAAAANSEFFNLAEWKEGFPYKENRTTVYSTLGEEMARRTNEAHGNFVVDEFLTTTKEKEPTNEGLIVANSYYVVVDPGLAYIGGVRVATNYNDYLSVERSLTTATEASQSVTANYGNYIRVNELGGYLSFHTGATVNLYSSAAYYVSNTSAPTATITEPTGQIGTARIRSVVYESGEHGTSEAVYQLYLFDINMNSGKSFRDVKSVWYNSGALYGVADIVQDYDGTSNTSVTRLYDTLKNKLVFTTGRTAVQSVDNVNYTYRTVTDGLTANTSGIVQVTLSGTGKVFPYAASSTLSANEKTKFIVIPEEQIEAAADSTGTVAISGTTVTGSGTLFTTEYEVGDYLKTDSGAIRQITSIANNTSMKIALSATVGAGNTHKMVLPASIPVAMANRDNRTITVNSDRTSVDIDFDLTTSGDKGVSVVYDVRLNNAGRATQTINRDLYVKIDTSNNVGGATGPWSLGIPNIARLKGVWIGSDTNVSESDPEITKYFYVDNGANENAYKNGRLVVPAGAPVTLTSKWLLVKFDAFTGPAGYYTVSSYALDDTKTLANSTSTINTLEIPELITTKGEYYDLRDSFDFRPYVTNTAVYATTPASATVNPANTNTLSVAEKYFPLPDSEIVYNIEYFEKRNDRLIINANGSFSVIQGMPSVVSPSIPGASGGAVTLAVFNVPQYPSLPAALTDNLVEILDKKVGNDRGIVSARRDLFTVKPRNDVKIPRQTRRYTMEDIGKLDRRIKELEYVSALSLLESTIKDKVIPSTVTPTVNRFKHGFLVDGFDTYDVADRSNREFKATIDQTLGLLKPATRQLNFEAKVENAASPYLVNGDVIMLPYTEESLIKQDIKTSVLGSDGQSTVFSGVGNITPASFSIQGRGEVTIVNFRPPEVQEATPTAAVQTSVTIAPTPPVIIEQAPEYTYGGSVGDGWGVGGGLDASVDSGSVEGLSCSAADGIDGGGGGGGSKIICTKLFHMGLMSKEIYEADQMFGKRLAATDPAAYYGYVSWAQSVAETMSHDTLIGRVTTYIAYHIATPWSYAMAEEMGMDVKSTWVGRAIMKYGIKLCRMLGKSQSAPKAAW